MSTATITIFIIAIVIVAVLAVRSGGPRVTHIDRKVRREKDSDDA